MTRSKLLALAVLAGACFAGAAAPAQAAVTVDLAAAPNCPYGYYAYPPYACAPSGYYGPEWFLDDAFIGTGPWFHGHEQFRGGVDHHLDVQQGYSGPLPQVGEEHDPALHAEHMAHFGGQEMHAGSGRR